MATGCTSIEYKAAALIHILNLETGPCMNDYCKQVIAVISDQGQRHQK